MKHQIKLVGSHRGHSRLYFQSQSLADNGFEPGATYSITTRPGKVVLEVNDGASYRVSRKTSGQRLVPVIDINNNELLGTLAKATAVKVKIEPGVITITRLASAQLASERLNRLRSAVAAAALTVGGLAFGGGILDHSAHTGLVDAGFSARTAVINEIDDDLVEHARGANPVIDKDTILISAPMQEAVQDDDIMATVPKVEVALAGIPCSGASRAGKSKHGIEIMEDHPEVGHLAHACLVFLHRMQPGVFVLENVPDYSSSASASIMRSQLRDMRYQTQELVLDAQDFGALEKRVRWFMVAATDGVELDLQNLAPPVRPVRTVAEILDKHGDHTWGEFNYLKEKAARDKAAGKGFQMQIVDPSSTKVPTLRKGYHKGGSTDPLLQHPDNANLLRLFSGDEHARIKGVDPVLVAGLSNTDKHIVLGQGVAPGPVRAILKRIGECLRSQFANCEPDEAVAGSTYRLDRAVG